MSWLSAAVTVSSTFSTAASYLNAHARHSCRVPREGAYHALKLLKPFTQHECNTCFHAICLRPICVRIYTSTILKSVAMNAELLPATTRPTFHAGCPSAALTAAMYACNYVSHRFPDTDGTYISSISGDAHQEPATGFRGVASREFEHPAEGIVHR